MEKLPSFYEDIIDVITTISNEVIPGTKALSSLYTAGKNIYLRHREEKLRDFIKTLSEGSLPEDIETWVTDPDTAGFFVTICRWMNEEEETKKAPIYANAFKIIANKEAVGVSRHDILRAVRDMTFNDFKVLQMLDDTITRQDLNKLSESDIVSLPRLRLVGAISEPFATMLGRRTDLGKILCRLGVTTGA